jgi:hypothetical protein
MPFVMPRARSLQGHPLVGTGDCVELVKLVPGLTGHSAHLEWRPGKRVLDTDDLPVGTAIATFSNGRYPDHDTGQHAALFLGYDGKSAFWVMDQWKNDKYKPHVSARIIYSNHPGGMSNSAEYFYVIELK